MRLGYPQPAADLHDRQREVAPLVELPRRGSVDAQHPGRLSQADRGAGGVVEHRRCGVGMCRVGSCHVRIVAHFAYCVRIDAQIVSTS